MPATPVTDLNGTLTKNVSDYGAFVFARRTNAVIDAHLASTQSAKPLFLYLTHQSVHEPLQSPAEYAAKCSHVTDAKRKIFCGMVGALDDAVYQVTSHMEARGLWDDTLFVCVPHAEHCSCACRVCASTVGLRVVAGQVSRGQWGQPGDVGAQLAAPWRQVHAVSPPMCP